MKEKILNFSKEKLGRELAAGVDHFGRVYEISKKLGLEYDDEILYAACFLHDLEEGGLHQEDAAQIAGEFLTTINFPKGKIKTVQEAILNHINTGNPQSNEAILLHDADLLDFLGATGIVRLAIGAWDWMGKEKLEDFLDVFKKFREDSFNNLKLEKSKEIAKEKVEFMDKAIEELRRELNINYYEVK